MSKELQQVSQAQQAIAAAVKPGEANEIRARLKAIQKYLAHRGEQYAVAFEAAKQQCEAAAKAGELWELAADRNRGGGKRQTGEISPDDAGFPDTKDASICVRLGELDPADRETYYDEMEGKRRFPTENGLHSVWKLLNAEEDEDRPWLRVYNLWNFAKPDERFGTGHPGNIPGQINMNLNYYLTEPGELIVDLFAGGGTTLDVCKEDNDDYGNRKCLAFDRKPVRKDIKAWDLTNGSMPFNCY